MSSRWRVVAGVAALLVLTAAVPWSGAAAEAGQAIQVPGTPAPELAKLFTPLQVPEGTYQVTVLKEGIDGAVRLVKGALAPGTRPAETPGAWQVQELDPLEAFGTAGPYDRSRVARLYAGRRASVARGPVEREGRVVAAVTLISPRPDSTLSHLEKGTLVILLRIEKQAASRRPSSADRVISLGIRRHRMANPMESPLVFVRPRDPKPQWLKVKAPGSPTYLHLKRLMGELHLNTVCEEAHCPNIGECWHHGTATFMILGDVCTRNCPYCAVAHGRPAGLDTAEPARVAHAAERMNLRYVVITSVDRDDLPDGGASIFAATITEIRRRLPTCRIEVLIPDFQGKETSLRAVLDAGPDILNHNTETVPRLYPKTRPGGRYPRTLELLDRARTYAPHVPTKSGLMVGIGEEWDEVVATLADLRSVGCGILTIGQYLRPSATHLPVARYYHPDEFDMLKTTALSLGFGHVESGPLVRSSYHAHEQADAYGESTWPTNA